MSWQIVTGMLGGVGMFLLGMRMMTDGLKLAAGTALRDMLGRWTNSTLKGLFSGALLTGLVQSSSAVTVATIGFVNAGLLTLGQGVGVIYGSNIGTTATGWLVAMIGFEFNIKAFSLPLIGVGMLARLLLGDGRSGRLAEVAAGFGLLFLGIDTLKGSFTGLSGAIDLQALGGSGLLGTLIYLGIGVALTFLMQSSSAAIAITLTAAGTGAVSLAGGAALVVGANIGTTSTAALSVIGATPNAKRVALAHMVFNVVTGVVALLSLPFLLDGLVQLRAWLGWQANAPAVLALFHTVFNLLGVLIMAPLTPWLVRFLQARFRTQEEVASRPQHLDHTVLTVPYLALRALTLELSRVAGYVRGLSERAISAEQRARGGEVVDQLLDACGQFAAEMRARPLPDPVAAALPAAVRAAGYLDEIANKLPQLDRPEATRLLRTLGLEADYEDLRERVAQTLAEALGPALEAEAEPPKRREVRKRYEALKLKLLQRATDRGQPIRPVLATLDHLLDLRQVATRARKLPRYLTPMLSLKAEPPPAIDAGEEPDEPIAPAVGQANPAGGA